MRAIGFFRDQTNIGQGLKWETRCNDTMNVMSEREFVLAVSFSGLNDDALDYLGVSHLDRLVWCK